MILTGMCLTDEHGSGITREQYWLTNANNKYFFWPRGRLPIPHMQDIPYEEGSLHPMDWSRREAHFRGEDEVVVNSPAPKKASGTARNQCAAVTSPAIETLPTVCNVPKDEQDIKFPHAAASTPDDSKPAARVKPPAILQGKTETVDRIGDTPVIYLQAANNALTQGTVPQVGESAARQLQLENEDDPIVGSDDEDQTQPSKLPRKSSRNGNNGRK